MKSVAPFEIGITVADIDAVRPFYRNLPEFRVLSDILVAAKDYVVAPRGLPE